MGLPLALRAIVSDGASCKQTMAVANYPKVYPKVVTSTSQLRVA